MTTRAAALLTAGALLLGGFVLCLGRSGTAQAKGAADGREVAASKTRVCRVLFIGNSFTHANDLPGLITRLGEASSKPTAIVCTMRAPGGETLDAHAKSPEVADLLRGQAWDWVVLQEQSRIPAYEGEPRTAFMYPAARKLDAMAKARGARVLFYETWGYKNGDPQHGASDTFDRMQQRLIEGYTAIARELSARVAPVGPAWARAHAARPDLALWGPDGMHPSPAGSYLAACVLYAMIEGHAPVGNSFHGGLSAPDARFLQQIAADATR